MFVTSDKGREKGALRELEGLIEEAMAEMAGGAVRESGDAETGGNGESPDDEARRPGDGVGNEPEDREDIEKDILAELEEMRGGSNKRLDNRRDEGQASAGGGNRVQDAETATKLGLITLDIPCVSFVRLPSSWLTSKSAKPVDLVYTICREAYRDPLRPRSRFIKRLTPVTRVKKVMNDGIERLCEEVLPPVFGMEQGKVWKYAIRVTVRNNNQVSKDDIIKRVAGFVQALGRGESMLGAGDEEAAGESRNGGNTSCEDHNKEESGVQRKETTEGRESSDKQKEITGQPLEAQAVNASALQTLEHKVDLKNFEKLVLVEVYRNVVGMSIVEEAKELEEDLKRFNLAEIYAAGRQQAEKDKKVGKETGD